jgi:2-methylcitrate dehydratase PrpD
MTHSSSGVSRTLADHLATARYDALPAPVVDDAKRAILDWLGSALAGASERPAQIIQQVVAGLGASGESTVFGATRSSAAGAALANGAASHILELDDVHKGSTLHGGAPVIPAALAVAERERASGAAFVLAVTVGYEAALRIGEAVNPSHYRFWHPTGTAATFGAAAAAGSLMGLDPTAMLHAFGSAGTQAAGLWEFNADGAMSKPLHPGKAAFNGILSADLARGGFTGATRILEGDRGFFRATAADYDPSRVVDGLGAEWKISQNSFKMHACCAHTHTGVDAALEMRADRLASPDARATIRDIRIRTYGPGFAIVRETNPVTPSQAQFSIAYCVATALAEGRVGLDQFGVDRFTPTGVRAGEVATLLGKTRVEVDDAMTAKYPTAWASHLAITLADGGTIERCIDHPRGNPENPVSTAVLEDKFRALVAPRLGDAAAARAIELVRSVERNADMSTVFRDFGATTTT